MFLPFLGALKVERKTYLGVLRTPSPPASCDTAMESDHARTPIILSCGVRMLRIRANQRANNNAAFSSRRGIVVAFVGASLVLVPMRDIDSPPAAQPYARMPSPCNPAAKRHKTQAGNTVHPDTNSYIAERVYLTMMVNLTQTPSTRRKGQRGGGRLNLT